MKNTKILVFIIIIFFVGLLFYFDLQNYLTLSYLKGNLESFQNYYKNNAFLTISSFFLLYIIVTALSIPGAAILTLAAGALFGLVTGFIIVSFASTIGATLAFLMARYFLKDTVQKKFGDKLSTFNKGVEKEGAFYLLSMRLIPIFPFFLINLVMGLTPIKLLTYFIVSQIGMLPGTIVYVNAGLQVSKLDSLQGILSPSLLGSFALLGIIPLISKKVLEFIKARKVYKAYKKPRHFDYNLVAIGGGSAGLVTTYIGAAVKAKVALIEKHKMGGDCLNTGCVPSKALIKSAKIVHQAKNSSHYGIKNMRFDFDFSDIMDRVQNIIKKIEPHDSVERYTGLGVDCIIGEAKILSPWEIQVNGKIITTKNIVIATGASPFLPPIPGLKDIDFLVSENLWDLREQPEQLVVLGGGPIGLEMAQSFQRLGTEVTVVEMSSRIMIKEDEDVSHCISERLTKEGVKLLTSHKAIEVKKGEKVHTLVMEKPDGSKVEIDFDKILVAVGRKANIKGFGLEELSMDYNKDGTILVNEYLQTKYPNIYACGDVAGPYQLTHMAAHQAWYCAVNALFGIFKRFKVDYSVVPWATYTDPEVATVGRMEEQLKADGVAYEVVRYGIDDLDRAIAESEAYGFVKVCVVPGKDKILGATIVGPRASDYFIEFVAAMKNNFGLNKILGTIHPYPTMAESNKYLAGQWKQMTKPEKLLGYVQKFMSWQRK